MSTPAQISLMRVVRAPILALVLAVVVGAVAGAVVAARFTADRGVPRVVQGVVTGVNEDAKSIGFTEDGGGRVGEGIQIAGDSWTDRDGNHFGGTRPSCLAPGSYGQRIEVAILEARGRGNWPAKLIVWVHCLT